MKHPKNQKSLTLSLLHNAKEDRYETVEIGVLYSLPFELVESLKTFYMQHESVEKWFAQLKPNEKQKVIRLGLPDNLEEYNDSNFLEEV